MRPRAGLSVSTHRHTWRPWWTGICWGRSCVKTYRVEYSAHAWQPRKQGHHLQPAEEVQIVQRALSHDWLLYVELARAPGGPPRVVIARITNPPRRARRKWLSETTRVLTVDDLDLVEVP